MVIAVDRIPPDFMIISLLSLIINYSDLVHVLSFSAVIALIRFSYTDTSFIIMNPYLRLKFDFYTLKSNDKTIYIMVEKEKEFARPDFSDYAVDWFYGNTVLIGFKKPDIPFRRAPNLKTESELQQHL